ncbi:hypothetical protein KP509_03G007100 [Ceratopteris richardii]|uniref:Uncharacterized protein n=1 Tax=Ceratopteris richardii TaxID=49495 RepID=A0A8T2UX26_CERRI|nr:hypothetical protein KP509_03G007100 [Ceratopteris richardii]
MALLRVRNILPIFAIVFLIIYAPLFLLMIALLTTLLLLCHGAFFLSGISPKQPDDTAAPARFPYSRNLRITEHSDVAPDEKQAGRGRLVHAESQGAQAKHNIEHSQRQSVCNSGRINGNNKQRQAPIDTLRNISLSHSVSTRRTELEHEEAEELRRRSDEYIQRVRAEFRTQR